MGLKDLPRARQLEALMRIPSDDPGDIIDYVGGRPVYAMAGGAAEDFTDWIPEDFSSTVIQKVMQNSVVEAYAQPVPMTTRIRSTPRDGGASVEALGAGGTYSEDASTNDDVILTAQKFGEAFRIDEEDIADSLADILSSKMNAWGTSWAKVYDNACLAVTAGKSTYTLSDGSHMAYDSLYYCLANNPNSTPDYTAGANIVKTAGGGVTYLKLSQVKGKIEQSDYYDEETFMWWAHPYYLEALREIVDLQGRPIFQESSSGFPGGGQGGTNYMLFGKPLRLSLGNKTSTGKPTSKPTGNPLLTAVSAKYALNGKRSGPESVFIDGRNGLAALQDQSILKARARRAFAPGHEAAFAVLEFNG